MIEVPTEVLDLGHFTICSTQTTPQGVRRNRADRQAVCTRVIIIDVRPPGTIGSWKCPSGYCLNANKEPRRRKANEGPLICVNGTSEGKRRTLFCIECTGDLENDR